MNFPKRRLLLLFFLPFLTCCGHFSTTLEQPSSPNITQPITQQESDWKEERQRAAETPDNSVVEPLPPETVFQESLPPTPLDAYIQQIVSFNPGAGYGYGYALREELLRGPPYGGGQFSGSVDVVSLGSGGEITLGFPNYFPIDGIGPDFIVFENPFQPRGGGSPFVEPAQVSVSQDGIHFIPFPCEIAPPYSGCASVHYVYANPELNNIDPRDPATAGGDPFDLALVGLQYARFIRIRDLDLWPADPETTGAGQSGFDLDAISIVHGAKP